MLAFQVWTQEWEEPIVCGEFVTVFKVGGHLVIWSSNTTLPHSYILYYCYWF